jgi:antitoxin component YwqK of YwqJK toxin-antitoxin module
MYINSINLGVFTFWGKTKLFEDKKHDGSLEIFFENGQSYQIGSYKNGKLDGSFKNYWHNGKLSDKGIYKNGKTQNNC